MSGERGLTGSQKILNTNNFVVLSSDYKKMLLNKIRFTNEKQ